ncbi:MAG: phosphotransferase [Thermoleophilia bacterium]|nr:phosphotransferase [Thermoleophilia bacterium]
MTRMHADEVDIDRPLVRRLLAAQFPDWADLALAPVRPWGTDNALYRLGDEMVVRLPRRERTSATLEKEAAWLPRLAPLLPLVVPVPLAAGKPAEGYPFPWSVYRWLDGELATDEPFADPHRAASDLAAFVAALQRADTSGGPPPGEHNFFRGEPLRLRDEATRAAIVSLAGRIDTDAATDAWEAALAAPEWARPPVWVHGDLDARNLLVRNGRLGAVIDLGSLGVGDPACDVMVAWKLFRADTRTSFRAALAVDGATWARGRGWALSQAVVALAYYTEETNAVSSVRRDAGCGRCSRRVRDGRVGALVAHWDDMERERLDAGEIRGWATDLGTAAGSLGVGVTRYQLDPGGRSSPVHVELAEEEIFFVLGGSGLLWQNGETHEVRAGDCAVARVAEHVHAFVAGDEGLDLLAYGQRADPPLTYLPRAGVVRAGVTLDVSGGPHPWEREAAAGPLELPAPSPRPENLVNLDELEGEFGGSWKRLGRTAGAKRTGLNWGRLDPGEDDPPHCHSAEEEIFVILDGEGTLLLGDDDHAVRRGHVISRPPGTGVAHGWRAGEQGLAALFYGTPEPNDTIFYPRTREVYLKGLRVSFKLPEE